MSLDTPYPRELVYRYQQYIFRKTGSHVSDSQAQLDLASLSRMYSSFTVAEQVTESREWVQFTATPCLRSLAFCHATAQVNEDAGMCSVPGIPGGGDLIN